MTTRRTNRRMRKTGQEWTADEAAFNTAPPLPPPPDLLTAWGTTRIEAREMLLRQYCPACGEGPWKSPINHASRKHGIDRFTMRNTCGLNTTESVLNEETRGKFTGRELTAEQARAMVRARDAKGIARRLTAAGAENLTATLEVINASPALREKQRLSNIAAQTPEVRARQGRSLAANWAKRKAAASP